MKHNIKINKDNGVLKSESADIGIEDLPGEFKELTEDMVEIFEELAVIDEYLDEHVLDTAQTRAAKQEIREIRGNFTKVDKLLGKAKSLVNELENRIK